MWFISIISHKHQINIPPKHHPLPLFSPFFSPAAYGGRDRTEEHEEFQVVLAQVVEMPGATGLWTHDLRKRNCGVEDIWVTYHIWPMNMILLYMKIIYYTHYQDVWYKHIHVQCIIMYMYNRIQRDETIMSIHDWSWLIVIIHSTDFWSFQFAAMVGSLAM